MSPDCCEYFQVSEFCCEYIKAGLLVLLEDTHVGLISAYVEGLFWLFERHIVSYLTLA